MIFLILEVYFAKQNSSSKIKNIILNQYQIKIITISFSIDSIKTMIDLTLTKIIINLLLTTTHTMTRLIITVNHFLIKKQNHFIFIKTPNYHKRKLKFK